MFVRVSWALAALAAVVFSGAASAEMSVSSSTNPDVVLDAQLTELLGAEKDALSSINNRRLERLVSPPATVSAPSDNAARIRYSREWLDAQPKARGGAEWQCLSEALYFEARGEAVKGQFAVAEVVLNRVASPEFPSTVCGVVHQGTGRRYQCQFTYTCDGHKEVITEPRAYARAGKIARLMLDGGARGLTGGATYYHTRAVNPRWARRFLRTASIGQHFFYRPPTRLSSN